MSPPAEVDEEAAAPLDSGGAVDDLTNELSSTDVLPEASDTAAADPAIGEAAIGDAAGSDVEATDQLPAVDDAAPPATDPSRRRAEFDSTRAVLVTVIATAALAITANAGSWALLVVVAVLQAALIAGAVWGTDAVGRVGPALVAALAVAGADVAVAHWPLSALSPLLAPLGLGVLALFIHQLVRGVARVRVMESIGGVAAVLVSGVAFTGYVQLRHEFEGRSMAMAATLAVGIAVALGQIVDLIWSRPRLDQAVPRGLPGIAVGTAAGAAVGTWILRDSEQLTTGRAVVVCAVLGAIGALVSIGASFVSYGLSRQDAQPHDEFAPVHRSHPAVRPVIVALLPLALAAPMAYVLFLSIG